MADRYIIAAGGTGAMCTQSFIYLAAAGCANKDDTYHILIVDKDRKSDAVTDCENLIRKYDALRVQLGDNENQFSFPKIILDKWNFTDEVVTEYRIRTNSSANQLWELTLRNLLNPDADAITDQLLKTMYTESELDTDLEKGFYGHPNIGTAVFNYVRERFLATDSPDTNGVLVSNSFMTSLRSHLSSDKTYVYLFGSLFGGTGATIIPNVVLALRSLVDPQNKSNHYGKSKLVLGGSVVMPYFRLPDIDTFSIEKLAFLVPSDAKFGDQTKEALRFYEETNLLGEMMNMLLVGSSQLDVTSELYSRGGEQHQHFHMVLQAAAIGANRFFANELGSMKEAVESDEVNPLGELLMWKISPDSVHNSTLTAAELGMGAEYANIMAFLRFSVVVAFSMQKIFSQSTEILRNRMELTGTAKQFTLNRKPLDPKNLSKEVIQKYYQEPVRNASEICMGFIRYFFDVAMSGYDWSGYHTHVQDAATKVTIEGTDYFQYILGKLDPTSITKASMRWVDVGNLRELQHIIEATSPDQVTNSCTLNGICSFEPLDEGRAAIQETRFPDHIQTIYDKTLEKIHLTGGFMGIGRRTDVNFSEIYDGLRANCQ